MRQIVGTCPHRVLAGIIALLLSTAGVAQAGDTDDGSARSDADAKAADERPDAGRSGDDVGTESDDGADARRAESSRGDRDTDASAGAEARTDRDRESGEPDPEVVAYCEQYRVQHAQSSARKLYRALLSREYGLERVGLADRITVKVAQSDGKAERVRFDVHDQNDGRSAALVPIQREYRFSYVVAMTDSGPIITKQEWPQRTALQKQSDCRPTRSWIEHPSVSADQVDPRPFDYWGIRILWRVPSSFREGSASWSTMETALRKVLGSS